jgi:imidazole glycerol-phosphate synthase subunit HisH
MSSDNKVVIVDYKMGNLRSVQKAFQSVGCEAIISNDAELIRESHKIVLPGVGAFGDGMKNLQDMGLDKLLNELVLVKKVPFLGICLGMQLVCKKSYEHGENKGLDWVDAEVVRFNVDEEGLKVPHVGWNTVKRNETCLLFKGIPNYKDFYFVHSYFVKVNEEVVTSVSIHGIEFVSSIQKGNIYAVQFHPEKSQVLGLKIIKNFLSL